MRITHTHNLSNDEAFTRINNLLNNLQKKYADKISNPQTEWDLTKTKMEFSVQIMGSNLSGNVFLEKHLVIIEGTIPFKFIIFSGTIENMIKQELIKLLS